MEEKKIIKTEKKLSQYEGPDKMISSEEMQEIIDKRPKPSWQIESGFPSLDRIVQGFEPGNLIVVSGKTGEGKSSLCQTMTKKMAKDDIDTAWFTFEMPSREFLKKFKDDLPLFYLPKEHHKGKLKWLKNRIWEAQLKYDIKAVFIDHLHELLELRHVGNTPLYIGGFVRDLKQTALYLDISIFLICHVKGIAADRRPTMGDLRDSALIAAESDYVLMIHREKDNEGVYTNRATVYLDKNRKTGQLGHLELIHKDGFFEELDWQHKADEKAKKKQYETK